MSVTHMNSFYISQANLVDSYASQTAFKELYQVIGRIEELSEEIRSNVAEGDIHRQLNCVKDELSKLMSRAGYGDRVRHKLNEPKRRPEKKSLPGLSQREMEIFSRIASGMGNMCIANELCLSINTIKTYIRRLYVKLGVTNRSDAIILYHTHYLSL